MSSSSSSSSSAVDLMPLKGLLVTMTKQEVYEEGSTVGFTIKIVVESDDPSPLPDNKVFLYHRTVPVPETGVVYDRFMAICSPLDMEEYPADTPNMNESPHYYRLNELTLVHTSKTYLLAVWEDIKLDLYILGQTIEAMSNLTDGETVVINFPAD